MPVAVRPESKMGEVEHWWRAGNLLQGVSVVAGCAFDVSFFDRHLRRSAPRANGARSSKLSRRCVRFRSGSPAGAIFSSTCTTCTDSRLQPRSLARAAFATACGHR